MTIFSDQNQTITVYGYDGNNVFCGAFEYFWAAGTGLAAKSTNIQPPAPNEGEVAIFDQATNTWTITQDHRGKTAYSVLDKTESKIDYLGEIKEGFTLLKPGSDFETWNGVAWEDQRSEQEITEYNRSLLGTVSKRQFSLYLYDLGGDGPDSSYTKVMTAINANTRFKIEFDTVADIERLSPTVQTMTVLLGWSDEQVDAMWEQALLL